MLASGDRLVAFVAGSELPVDALRRHLSERVPGALVPSSWVVLASLPRSATGKVDRRALGRLASSQPSGWPEHVAPREGVEEALAGLWAEVLGLERVSARSSFFELGGHSLLATRVVSRVRESFGVELPLRSLFESPTVSGLALRIEALLGVAGPSLPPIRPVPRGGDLPLSFAQERLWFLNRLEPESPAYNVPAAVRLRGALDGEALAASLSEVVRRHESLRTRFVPGPDGPVQRVEPAVAVELPVIDLSGAADAEAEAVRLRRAEARRPFDLERGPLLRATLLRLSGSEHELLLTLHHIVSDGWSLGVLVEELGARCASLPGLPGLPDLPVQYGDYAVWQREYLTGEVLASRLSFWRERLAGAPAGLELPADRPRPAVGSSQGGVARRALGGELASSLARLSRGQGATLYMALLSAFGVWLARSSGEEDLVVGTPVANR
ncbi:MAG TPA: condensation domain-containing protein, partial [Candidatus Dormibacteraeota bacterium]